MLTVCPRKREKILKKIWWRKRNHSSLKMRRLLKHSVQGAWVNYTQKESKCNKCCKVGPLAKTCKSQSHKRVREVNFPGRQEEKGFFLGELTELDAVQESTGEVKEQVYVTEYLQRPLLGRKPAELLKLISRLDSLSSNHYRIKVADKYPKLSTD